MCDKNLTTSNGKKLYLVTFEFISGEYGQIFQKKFYARDPEHLERKIHEYLIDYYGIGNTSESDHNVYFYWKGQVAVKPKGWAEITSFERLAGSLL
ncbi:MAG: hypothetical protein AB1480_05365 [Nitrospirota bacterium]